MSFTASGALTEPFARAKAMLASSSHFRDWLDADWAEFHATVGTAARVAKAMERIFIWGITESQHAQKPYAIITPSPTVNSITVCDQGYDLPLINGSFELELVRNVPDTCMDEDGFVIYEDAYNDFGGYEDESGTHGAAHICNDILSMNIHESLSVTPMLIRSWHTQSGPGFAQDEESVNSAVYCGVIIRFMFGLEAR